MKALLLLLYTFLSTLPVLAARNSWTASFSTFAGLPVFKEPDNFYLKNYDAGFDFNFSVYYKTKSGWQFGLVVTEGVLLMNDKKTEASIIEHYSNAHFLNSVSTGHNPVTASLFAEVGKTKQVKRWRITPFFRAGILYSWPVSSHNNFSLRQKVPDEHYYKETRWQFSDSGTQIKFAPILLTGGLRIAYQVKENYDLYVSAQYQAGSIAMSGTKRQEDFYGVQSAASFQLQQQYNLLGLEIGMQFRLIGDKRKKIAEKL